MEGKVADAALHRPALHQDAPLKELLCENLLSSSVVRFTPGWTTNGGSWHLGRSMHLVRCQDQKSGTLEEFYTEVSEHDNYASRECGKAMLELLARLEALPDERRVFGLTSHYRLCFLTEDTYKSPWYVLVWALDKRNFFVEYRMPDDIAPWPHAFVRGEARSEADAIQMILTAMDKSGGWSK